jgi:hypothetical protein
MFNEGTCGYLENKTGWAYTYVLCDYFVGTHKNISFILYLLFYVTVKYLKKQQITFIFFLIMNEYIFQISLIALKILTIYSRQHLQQF